MALETRTLLLSDRRVDLASRMVLSDHADPVELTPLETAFLTHLAERPGETVERDELLREVWGYAASVQSRAIDKSVHRLRIKVEVDPAEPRHLIGVRGMGYRLEDVRLYSPHLGLGDAAELLREAAQQAGIEPTRRGYDPDAIRGLAALLGGHPEPIRLLAPRMALLGPRELEAHVRASIAAGNLEPERWLAALRTCVDEQWGGLSANERDVIARLGALPTSFTAAAAVACQPQCDQSRSMDVLDRASADLMILAEPTSQGPPRLRLGPAVRERALQHLRQRGERAEAFRRAATQFLVEAEALERQFGRGDVQVARASLVAIEMDLAALLEETVADEPVLATRALLVFCAVQIRLQPRRILAWMDQLMPGPADPHRSFRSRLLVFRGLALQQMGRVAEAHASFLDALSGTTEPVVRAEALLGLGSTGYWSGPSIAESIQHLHQALDALQHLEELRLEARLWVVLGSQIQRSGDLDQAYVYYTRALKLFRASRDLDMLGVTQTHAASALYAMGRFEDALAASREASAFAADSGDRVLEVQALLTAACCHLDLGRPQETAVNAEAARALAVELGAGHQLTLAHACCGYAALGLGLHEDARYHFRAFRRIAEEAGNLVLVDSADLDFGLEAHLRGALEEARAQYERVLASAPGRAVVAFCWWAYSLRILLAAEESDLASVRTRAGSLRAILPTALPAAHQHHEQTLALAEALLGVDGPAHAASTAELLQGYAARLRPELGHEPRQLARLAQRGAERLLAGR